MPKNKVRQRKYDVFVSFRGDDIRQGFLSHLVETFKSKKINAFVDDEIDKGDEIWPSLVGAIEESFIILIIFSQDYASSPWCLNELVTILECREKHGLIVIPLFYRIEPTDVRHQLGSYKNAFDEHEVKYKSKVSIWRHAMNKSTDLSGIVSSKFRDDAELLKEIVNLVLTRLDKNQNKLKGNVGNDKKVANVEPFIRKEPIDICIIQKVFNKLWCGNKKSCDMNGKKERETRWACDQRAMQGLYQPETSFIFNPKSRYAELSEPFNRIAEIARLRELHRRRGEVETIVKLKSMNFDLPNNLENYSV